MSFKSLALAVTLVSLGRLAAADTDVSGEITTTTWTAIDAPYRVKDTVIVPAGNTLTIAPNVDVLFDADVPFMVLGAIHAVGSESDSIRFIAGTSSRWRGLRLHSVDDDTCTLEYVRLSEGHAEASNFVDQHGYGGGLSIGMSIDGDAPRLRVGLAHVVTRSNYATVAGGVSRFSMHP